MKKMRKLLCVVALMLMLGLLTGCVVTVESSSDMDLTEEILNYIDGHYIDGLNIDDADVAASAGILSSLDPFSYLTLAYNSSSGSSHAMGILFSITEYHEYIISHVYKESPAAVAESEEGYKLTRGDRVYSINDVRIEGLSSSDFQEVTAAFETATFKVYRGEGEETISFEITITKGAVLTDYAWYINDIEGIPQEYGYIYLSEFTSAAQTQFIDCVQQFIADENEYLILDLRNNSGGDSDALAVIASYLVTDRNSSNRIHILDVDITYNKTAHTTSLYTKANNYIGNSIELKNILVLVNGQTASAAEALTGAIRAYGTGTVIGSTTFGKGVAQSTDKVITDNTGVQYRVVLVTGRYYIIDTSVEGGRYCVHGVGITPDIQTEATVTADLAQDADIQAAIKYNPQGVE